MKNKNQYVPITAPQVPGDHLQLVNRIALDGMWVPNPG